MRSEPRVDAVLVEGVAALGQQPQRLALTEIVKTNGAVVAVDDAVGLRVRERRDGVDRRLGEADGADVPDRVVQHGALALVGEIRSRRFQKVRIPPAPVPGEGEVRED